MTLTIKTAGLPVELRPSRAALVHGLVILPVDLSVSRVVRRPVAMTHQKIAVTLECRCAHCTSSGTFKCKYPLLVSCNVTSLNQEKQTITIRRFLLTGSKFRRGNCQTLFQRAAPFPLLWDPSHWPTVITHHENTFCSQRLIVAWAAFKATWDLVT